MYRVRLITARVLTIGAAGMFLAWLLPALAGREPELSPNVHLGHWTNFRLVAWLLLGAAVLHPAPSIWRERLERLIRGRGQWLFPLALAAIAVWAKVSQHLAFGTGAYDLSMYHSAVRHAWSDGPAFMWAFGIERNFLSEHFSPVLLAFVPLDIAFRSPLAMLVTEGLVFGLGAFTLAGLARALGVRPLLAQVAAITYATNVLCWRALSFDFHPEAMIPAGVFAVAWAMREKRRGWLIVTLLATLSIKEDVAIILIPVVLIVGLDERRNWRWPVFVSLISAAWLIFALKVALPLASPPGTAWGMFEVRYGEWGPTPGSALVSMLGRPLEVLQSLGSAPVRHQIGELAWMPLLDPVSLIASAPAILEQTLSNYVTQQNLELYYGIGAVTVWLLSLLRVTRWVERWLGFTAALLVVAAPLAWHPRPPILTAVSSEDLEDDRVLSATIPPGASVLAQSAIIPHLPISPAIDLFPGTALEFVALRPSAFPWPLTDQEYDSAVLQLLEDEGLGVVVARPGLVLLRRGAPRGDVERVKALLLQEKP